jgi:DNA polymerase elongation subunit (family B)
VSHPKILEIDIETAPATAWVWGLFNQNIGINQIAEAGRTICWAAKWHGKKKMHFSSEWGDGQDTMVERAWELFNEADIVVHYNGTKFDVPTLNREFVKDGLTPPSPFRQIDLLQTVRKQFRFQSNKLDFVCQQLGLGTKAATGGFELWKGVMDGDGPSQRRMARYNKQDVLLLEELYNYLLPWFNRTPNIGTYLQNEVPTCTKCGSTDLYKDGTTTLQAGKYQQYGCRTCGGWSRGSHNLLTSTTRRALARPAAT